MKKLKLFMLTLVLGGMLFSCGKKYNKMAPRFQNIEQSATVERSGNDSFSNENKARKIIFSADLSLLVKNPDTANFYIEKIAKQYSGYVNEIGTYRTIIRVESKKLNKAMDAISDLGKIQDKNISGQDVTGTYLDYEIRLDNAQKARDRYLELLTKAENVQAALLVEKELERLNEVIDLLKGRMNRISHLSELSTITIRLKEKKKPGLLGYIGIGIYRSVKWLFVRN